MIINPKFVLQLVEIVRTGSFTEAADSLNLTQPALSRNMREFEQYLGPTVLERGRLGAKPTEFGARVLRYAQVVQEMLSRIELEASAWQRGELGSMQIGATPHPSLEVTRVLGDFLGGRSELVATLEVSDLPSLLTRLESAELDIVVGPTGMIRVPSDIVISPLFTDELTLFAGKDHPLAGRRKISNKDLQASNWIGHPLTSSIHRQATSILAAKGLSEIRVQVRVAMFPDFVNLLTTNRYLALLPRRLMRQEIESGRIVTLPTTLEGTQWPIGILHRNRSMLPESVQRFADTLVDEFAR